MRSKQVRSWMMYDWANSAFATTMLAAVLPIFYQSVAASGLPNHEATSYWAFTQTIGMILVALLSPILGAMADLSRRKMAFLRVFAICGSVACMLLFFAGNGDWLYVSVLFILATIGFSGGNTFYDSLLPEIAAPDERDEISAKGYMYGYIGGGVLLAVNIVMLEKWEMLGFPNKLVATQTVFLSVGIWWLLFSLPIFRHLQDPARTDRQSVSYYTKQGFGRLAQTIKRVKHYPELLKYMVSFWFFNDGISTIIGMAAIYGAGMGIQTSHLIIALLITQFVGIPFTYLFAKFARRLGSKRSLYVSLSTYIVIVFFGYFMTTALHFYILAFLVGMVQGGSQAVARSVYSQMVPISRASEFFGFLSLSSKVSASIGPAVFGMVGLMTGSTRLAILSILGFFIIGIILLAFVDIEKGRKEAAMEEDTWNTDASGGKEIPVH
ncbi:MFS transporter [Paenibacillus alvei]|uniref:MFS transporter, UMF1 family n=1 Tax=Paenibacillus alvei TaxID=44250 RepID=A0A383R701_PAEAL|nr:MFS transporter [Paenibacillus alvei]SYX82116.1 MFS transporter, UMF1 family [Paenibacillus alvei]